jgi:hypothetical protein
VEEIMMPVYACSDRMSYFLAPSPCPLPDDITIRNLFDIPNGVYRRVDAHYLGWVEQRVNNGLLNPKVDVKQLGAAIMFFVNIRDLSGLTPAAPPAGYAAPPPLPIPEDCRKFVVTRADFAD